MIVCFIMFGIWGIMTYDDLMRDDNAQEEQPIRRTNEQEK